MIAVICAMIGGAIILLVVAVALLGWAGLIPAVQRAGLYMLAAGLLWAAPGRFLATPGPGLGDLLFLAGIATLLGAIYGRAVLAHVEALDGKADGQFRPHL